MFDFHLHSSISFDSDANAESIIKRAEQIGLKEICFTDHYDFWPDLNQKPHLFDLQEYNKIYNSLSSKTVKIRKGVEYGLTNWNAEKLTNLFKKQNFDFIIGSVHYLESGDPYDKSFWIDKTVDSALKIYFEEMYKCVKIHKDFDVLGHLTYISKCPPNPSKTPVKYENFSDIIDEILKELVNKSIGLEVNTSGFDPCGVFLPSSEYLKRFKELGGQIITIGSDAHNEKRVGQYSNEALEILKDIFGYVCTFENRKPIFHKL